MKHEQEGYCLFSDDHVRMVGFPPDFATDSYCLFRGIVKPSFKTTGSYSTVAALSKISSYVLAQCDCKAGAGGCCKLVAALLCNILDYVELELAIIPEDKTCIDTSQQWSRPRNIPGDGPNVHHSYGKRKAEVAAARLDKYKSAMQVLQFCLRNTFNAFVLHWNHMKGHLCLLPLCEAL